jgi:KDO2-lipid IV(A) lauroyltransferase
MGLRELRSWAGYRALALLVRFGALLPEQALSVVGRSVARIAPHLSPPHRRLAQANIRAAFGGQLPEEQIGKLVQSFYEHTAASFVELATGAHLRDDEFDERVEIVGLERLQSALEKRCGAILLTAHIGNWELAYRKLTLRGYTFNAVARDQRDIALARLLGMTRTSMNLLPQKGAVSAAAGRLRHNELVAFVLDENAGARGVFVEFMGRFASTHIGPAVVHLRTRTPVVPAFTWRKQQGRHVLEIWPELALRHTGDGRADVLYNTAVMAKAIEKMIRQHPGQWLWTIRRWRTRPQWE